MKFCTIDFETANRDRASVCQVGVVVYENSAIVNKWQSLINPETNFEWNHHTEIHGISQKEVLTSPIFSEVFHKIEEITKGNPVFHKSMFDRQVYEKSAARYGIQISNLNWYDATEIIKEIWVGLKDYSLGGICDHLSYSYHQHDALEDAIALGHVLQAALKINGEIDLSKFNKLKNKKSNFIKRDKIKRVASVSGPLNGLMYIFSEVTDKNLLANMACEKGANVIDYPTSKVTHLVLGDSLIDGRIGKTTKWKKVEELNSKGLNIIIMSESSFINYISSLS